MRTCSIPELGALYKKKKKKKERKKKKKRKKLGQYNSNNKLIHGQYTCRYNLHHTNTRARAPQQVK